jgi:hypothetical protein
MMRVPAPFVGIVSFGTPLLIPIAGNDGTVKVYGETADIELVKKPVLQLSKNLRVLLLVKLTQKTTVGTLGGHGVPAEYGLKNLIIS